MKSVLKAKTASILLILVSIDFIYSGCAGCRVRGKSSDKVGDSSKEKNNKKSHDELSKLTIRRPIVTPRKNEEVKKIVINSDLRGRENIPYKSRISVKMSDKSGLPNQFGLSRINQKHEDVSNCFSNKISLYNNNVDSDNVDSDNVDSDNEIELVNDNIEGMRGNILENKNISKNNNSISVESNVIEKSMDDVILDNATRLSEFTADDLKAKTSVACKGHNNNSITNSTKYKEGNSDKKEGENGESNDSIIGKIMSLFSKGVPIEDYNFNYGFL